MIPCTLLREFVVVECLYGVALHFILSFLSLSGVIFWMRTERPRSPLCVYKGSGGRGECTRKCQSPKINERPSGTQRHVERKDTR